MAGVTSFKISLFVKNEQILPEIAERVKDLSPAFDNIIEQWARGNKRKFDEARGQEAYSVDQGGGVWWDFLTYDYRKRKRREGFPDWLMVKTGALRDQMINQWGFDREVTPESAVFGSPSLEANKKKVKYNWETRQTIFINESDKKMISSQIKNYITLGENYKDILFKKGLENVRPNWAEMFIDWNTPV